MRRILPLVILLAFASPAAADPPVISDPGPCTNAAKMGMPNDETHDHDDPAQHQGLFCRIRQTDFQLMGAELAETFGTPSPYLGEMDAKKDLLAVAVDEPVGGALFFDIADPAKPKYLSNIRIAACGLGVNCGAYIEVMADGQWAVMGIQQTDLMPGLIAGSAGQFPGVALIDLRDPKNPVLAQEYPTVSVYGAHTARSYVHEGGAAPGEYVYLIQNQIGIEIVRVVDSPLGKRLVHLRNLPLPGPTNTGSQADALSGSHDTFIQTDPIDKKTYLYVAGGFSWGFRVFDVDNPANPVEVASWDPTPSCYNDWYSHTIDVTHRGNRRYVTMPAEQFHFGAPSGTDCLTEAGNGDQPGTMWVVDASDWSKLPQYTDSEETIKQKSLDTLRATWISPSGAPSENLVFSAHNQQIAGDKIYLSAYHGGVFVLDASDVFGGGTGRPKEVGWAVPASLQTRESFSGGSWTVTRSDFWDVVFHKDHMYAADRKGGLYTLAFDGDATGGTPPAICHDRTAPTTTLRAKLTRRGATLSGTASDAGCDGRVARVLTAVALVKGKKCRWLSGRGRLGKAGSCAKPSYLPARGTDRWSFKLKAKLRKATYRVAVSAFDASGNASRARYKRVRLAR